MNKQFLKILISLGFLSFFVSCTNSDDPKGNYENGVLISGEGSGAGSASVYFLNDDLKTVEPRIYKNINNAELGTFLQSISFDDEYAHLIVDEQKTITVVNRYTFKKVGEITTGLLKPRYMTIVGNKGYVTDWGEGTYSDDNREDDYIAVVDMQTRRVVNKINVGAGPERVVAKSGKLYVSHKGGFGTNNIISVIDIATQKVIKEIKVNDAPDELVFDTDGNLLVLSSGKEAWTGQETNAAISKINLSDYSLSKVEFPNGTHPSLMAFSNGIIYYSVGDAIYKIDENEFTVSDQKLFVVKALKAGSVPYLYGLSIKDQVLYVLNANFKDVSELHVFNLSSNQKITTVEAPLGASKIYFN